jgi:hypothetical protein
MPKRSTKSTKSTKSTSHKQLVDAYQGFEVEYNNWLRKTQSSQKIDQWKKIKSSKLGADNPDTDSKIMSDISAFVVEFYRETISAMLKGLETSFPDEVSQLKIQMELRERQELDNLTECFQKTWNLYEKLEKEHQEKVVTVQIRKTSSQSISDYD